MVRIGRRISDGAGVEDEFVSELGGLRDVVAVAGLEEGANGVFDVLGGGGALVWGGG